MRARTPAAALALGTTGSALVAAGGFGVGALPAALVSGWPAGSPVGRVLAAAAWGTGLGLLLLSWWLLRDAGRRPVLAAAGLWSVPLLLAPPLLSRDVYAYAGQARLVDVGLDPYAHGPADAPGPLAAEVDRVWAGTPAPYGPVFLRLAALLVRGEHVVSAVVLLRLLAVAGLVLVAWSLARLVADPARAWWLAVTNPLVLLHGIGGAHNDLLMAGLLMTGLALAVSAGRAAPPLRRDGLLVLATASIVLAALVKAPAAAGLLFVPFLVTGARRRAAAVVATSAGGLVVAFTVAAGLGWGWLHTVGAGGTRRSLMSVSTGIGVLASQVAGPRAVDVAHAAGLGVAGLVGLVLLVRVRQVGALRALGLALLTAVALGPVGQPWYLLWPLPVLAAVAGARLAAGLAAASAVLCLLVLPNGRQVIRPPLYGVPALLAAAAACAGAYRQRMGPQVDDIGLGPP